MKMAHRDYTESPTKSPTKVGLRNLGNTCYMNSAIQALYSCDSFRDRLLSEKPSKDKKVTCELRKVFALLAESKKPSITPEKFLDTAIPSWFSPGKQQDSSEFMRHVLNTIDEEGQSTEPERPNSQSSSKVQKPHISSKQFNNILIQEMFGIKLTNTYTCERCKNSNEKDELRLDLILPFPTESDEKSGNGEASYKTVTKTSELYRNNNLSNGVADVLGYTSSITDKTKYNPHNYTSDEVLLEDMLAKFEKEELIHCYCEHCNRDRDIRRKTVIKEYPAYLILILGRFKVSKYTRLLSKIMDPVVYSSELTLPIHKKTRAKENYFCIKASVAHIGTTLYGGHYTCDAKHWDNYWYDFDDSVVSKEQSPPQKEIPGGITTSCILIYRKKAAVSTAVVSLPKELKDFVKEYDESYDLHSIQSWERRIVQYGISETDFQNLAVDIGIQWKKLSDHLNISPSTVANFERRVTDTTEACYTMLCHWLANIKEKTSRSDQQALLNQAVNKVKGFPVHEDMDTDYHEDKYHTAMSDKGTNDRDCDIQTVVTGITYSELKNLAANVGKDWKLLATYLGMSLKDVEYIERKYPNSSSACYEMLRDWKILSTESEAALTTKLNSALHQMKSIEKSISRHVTPTSDDSCDDPNRLVTGVTYLHLDNLAANIGKEWKTLAIYLNISPDQVEDLDKMYHNPANACCQMLSKWKSSSRESEDVLTTKLNKALHQMQTCPNSADNTFIKKSLTQKNEVSGVSNSDLKKVATHVGSEWKTFGKYLHVSTTKIETIERSNMDPFKMCLEMLHHWQIFNPNSATTMIEELNEALNQLNSKKLEKKHTRTETGMEGRRTETGMESSRTETWMEGIETTTSYRDYYGLTDKDFQNIAADLSDKWRLLAKYLHISERRIEKLGKENSDDMKACYEMLNYWKVGITNEYASRITELNEAIKETNAIVDSGSKTDYLTQLPDMKRRPIRTHIAENDDNLNLMDDPAQKMLEDAMFVVRVYGEDIEKLTNMAELFKVSNHELVVEKLQDLLRKHTDNSLTSNDRRTSNDYSMHDYRKTTRW